MAVRDMVATLAGAYTGPLYYDLGQFWAEEVLVGASAAVRGTIVDRSALPAYGDVVRSHRVVMGHVAAATLTGAGCTRLAIQVREPRSRLLSLYRYWQSQAGPHLSDWGAWGTRTVAAAGLPLHAFLTSPAVRPAVDNAIARQALADPFAPGADPARWSPDGATLARFVDRVAVAEWSTASDRFVERIWDVLGEGAAPAPGRVNVTEVTAEPQRIDGVALEALERWTRLDTAFLGGLAAAGVLGARPSDQLEREFADTAERLGFALP